MIGEKGFAYNAGSDEFGVIKYEKAEKTYKVGDKLELIAPHCDPVVNEYDQMYAIRKDRVEAVWPNVRYHAARTVGGPEQIGADRLWGATFASAGNGMKIAVIDDGLDATNPYFDPNGFQYPAGFPKGQTQHTTPKVIVQRTFAPPAPTWKYANTPFDPTESFHATHVAGIAAGDHGTQAGGTQISGVAPNAYLGNYKALTIPTPGFGLDGNSAELAAAGPVMEVNSGGVIGTVMLTVAPEICTATWLGCAPTNRLTTSV